MKRLLRFLVIIIAHYSLLITHLSCTQDTYDKGDGQYSYLRGDFAEAVVGADKKIVSLITDEGESLPLSQPCTAKWITTSDTIYRCMLYYNKVRDDKGQYLAEPISVGEVPCPVIVPLAELDTEMKTDPVSFESAWMSKTGKYINLSFALKTGKTEDDEAIHTLRVVQDTIMVHPDGSKTSYLRLFHDQGGVPDYYSTQVYASIITSEILADSVRIAINTYKGVIEKSFLLSSK